MSFLYNSNGLGSRQNNRSRSCSCGQSNNNRTEVESEGTQGEPQTVRALLNTIMGSCCVTDDVCRELTFSADDICPDDVEVGTTLGVEVAGDITFQEVTRDKDDCSCVSTVHFNIPIRILLDESGCGCGCSGCILRNITVIRSAKLCCSSNSILTTYNSRVIAASAVVSDITDDGVTVTICLLFRSCLQQSMLREFTWTATPICENANCNNALNNLLDSCDPTCACTGTCACPNARN